MKLGKILLIIFLVILLIPLSINFYVIFSTQKYIKEEKVIDEKYPYALVLGCGVKKNGEPSKMLKDRLDMTINLYNLDKIEKIIISGTHKNDYSEVIVMNNYLIEKGIPKDKIILDKSGNSTSESIKNYAKNYQDKVIIITQNYHLYRSLYLAHKNKVEAIGCPAKRVRYNGQIGRDVREIMARVKDFLLN